MSDLTPEQEEERKVLYKEAVKEALKEWTEQKYIELGKWTFRGMCAMLLGTVVYIWLGAHGWKF